MSPRETLLHLLAKHAVKQNRVMLTNGEFSDFFIEARRVTLSAAGAHFIGLAYLDRFKELELDVDAVGGVESAAPLAISISAASFPTEKQIQTFLIRRKTTFGGKKLWVDNHKGGFTVLVEDVTTNGNSIVDSLTKAAEIGVDIQAVVTLIDREEGAADRIKSMCPFYSVFTAKEIFSTKQS